MPGLRLIEHPAPKVRSAGIGDRVGFFATRAILRLDSDLSVCQQAIKRALNAAGARTVDERYTSLKVLCQFVQALRQKREKSKDDVSHADDSTSCRAVVISIYLIHTIYIIEML